MTEKQSRHGLEEGHGGLKMRTKARRGGWGLCPSLTRAGDKPAIRPAARSNAG